MHSHASVLSHDLLCLRAQGCNLHAKSALRPLHALACLCSTAAPSSQAVRWGQSEPEGWLTSVGAREILGAVDLGGVEASALQGLGLGERIPRELGTHDERGLASVLQPQRAFSGWGPGTEGVGSRGQELVKPQHWGSEHAGMGKGGWGHEVYDWTSL